MCSGNLICRGVFIDEGAMLEEGPGALTPWWRGSGAGRATYACGALVAPLLLSFGSMEASG
jgi:hypothetical protein